MTLADDVHGDGPPLLLVRGITLDRRMWEPNMKALTARHRVVRCDLRGFGETPPPDGPYSHARDLRDLRDHMSDMDAPAAFDAALLDFLAAL